MSSEKKVLIYGGKGGLGTVLVSHFKSNGWTVISVDLAANDVADANVLVNPNDDWAKQVLIPNDKTLKFIKSGSATYMDTQAVSPIDFQMKNWRFWNNLRRFGGETMLLTFCIRHDKSDVHNLKEP